MQKLIKIWTSVLLLTGPSSLYAYPLEVSYSGRLTDQMGKAIEGSLNIQVKFYRSESASEPIDLQDGSEGINAESDTLTFSNVTLSYGVFSIPIKLTAADFHRVFNGVDNVYIEITDLTNRPTTPYPRQKYTMLPFAFKVPVDGVTLSYNEEGKLMVNEIDELNNKLLNHDQAISQNSSKTNLITVTEAVNLDSIKAANTANSLKNSYPSTDQQKVNHLSVSQAVNLDDIKTKADHLTVTRGINLDHITVTSAVNLDDLTTKANASKTKTDLITVSGSSVDLNDMSTKANASKTKTDLITVSGSSVNLNTLASDVAASKTKTDLVTVTSSVNLNTLASDAAASKAKTDLITVSSAVDLNTMASNISTNTTNIAANAITTTSLTQADSLYLATDEIRARDSGGLKLNQKDGTAGMIIDDNGKVGVRMSTPAASLDVGDPSDGTGANVRIRRGLRDDWLELKGPGGSPYTASITGNYFGVDTTHNFINFTLASGGYATAGDLLLQKDGGKIGIGTTTPATNMELSADGGQAGVTALRIVERNAQDSIWELRAGDDNGGGSSNYNFFEIYGGEEGSLATRLLITKSGSVGIGTTAPKSTLDVAGVKLGSPVTSAESRHNALLVSKKADSWVATNDISDADALNNANTTIGTFSYNLTADGLEGERIFVKMVDTNADAGSSVRVRVNSASARSINYSDTGYTMNDGSTVTRVIDITDDVVDGSNTVRVYANSSDAFSVGSFSVFSSASYIRMGEPIHKEQIFWNNVLVNGKLGIGNTSPTYNVDVTGDVNVTGCYKTAGTNIVGGSCASDERFKKDIHDLPSMLDLIKKLRVVSYHWRSDEFPDRGFSKDTAIGVIAQEVKEIFPELVAEDKDGFLKVDFTRLHWYLAKAVSELAVEKDSELASMTHKVSEKELEIAKISKIMTEKDQEIHKLNSQLEGLKAYLCEKDMQANFCKE